MNCIIDRSKLVWIFPASCSISPTSTRAGTTAASPWHASTTPSASGYCDELLWAAAWLYQASDDRRYLDYLANNADALGGTGWSINQFGWDVKYPGVQVLAAMILLQGHAGGAHAEPAEGGPLRVLLPRQGRRQQLAPDARRHDLPVYHQSWNNVQFVAVTSAAFLLSAYSDHLAAARQAVVRGGGAVGGAPGVREVAGGLHPGSSPRATSYMVGVGYDATFPQRAHHRGASIVSIKTDPAFVSCRAGFDSWYGRPATPTCWTAPPSAGLTRTTTSPTRGTTASRRRPPPTTTPPLMGVLARLGGGHASSPPALRLLQNSSSATTRPD